MGYPKREENRNVIPKMHFNAVNQEENAIPTSGSEWKGSLRDPDYDTSSEEINSEELFSDNERKRARKSHQLNKTETDVEITESSSIRVTTDSLHHTEQNKPWARSKR
jgi:hypothetical protein